MTEPLIPVKTIPGRAKKGISLRKGVQFLFLTITLFLGIKFYLFVAQLGSGAMPTLERPPGVEAFLPISALVSLKYFLFTGIFNRVHPSALVLFLIICATALVVKKGFCSWICPLGLVSDFLAKLNGFFFKRRWDVPPWADFFLRTVKYSVAGFFVWSIFFKMPVAAIGQFIQSPYNTFADIKMLEFFTKISFTSFWVITALLVLSVLIKHFWCRYLCPYGAILGVLGFLSMGKIRRKNENCIKCGNCESVCPGKISLMDKGRVHSLECSTCLGCVDVCPSKNAIGFSLFSGRMILNQKKIALVLIVFFMGGITIAKGTGHWQNNTSVQAYREHVLSVRMSERIPAKMDPEKMRRMIEKMRRQIPPPQ